ncbi:MAG: sugar transferase [Oceanipulchritudo sp.]
MRDKYRSRPSTDAPSGPERRPGKRLLDLLLVLLAAPLWIPLVGVVALLVAVKLGRPVLFRQTRPGRDGEPFRLVKFRTMTDARDARGQLLPDAERLTGFGRWLRSTSLDELPELWNVLRGEMSLVGPRPLLMHYLEHYTTEEARRHAVRPGLTGWAQIKGRNAVEWDDKLALDVWYVDHQSLWLDLKILWLTLWAVLVRRGIAAEGEATAPDFAHRRRARKKRPSGTADALDDRGR